MHAAYEDILDLITAGIRREHSYDGDPYSVIVKRTGGAGGCENIIDGKCACEAKPLWWDDNGVPRFAVHHPKLCPDIYADQVALVLISCQGCGQEFPVQMSWSMSSTALAMARSGAYGPAARLLEEALSNWEAHYEDQRTHGEATPHPRVAAIRAEIAALKSAEPASLADHIRSGKIHYGDPPNVDCCAAGPTMNCWDLRVVEFWARGFALRKIREPENKSSTMAACDFVDWTRVAEFEIELPDATNNERLERV